MTTKYSEQEKFNLHDELADKDSFEEKSRFMGVNGTDADVLARIEKIRGISESIPTTDSTDPTTSETKINSIICFLSIIMLSHINKKKKNL